MEPGEIARAVEYLMDHPDVCKSMSENGIRAAREKYNWEGEEKRLLALYKQILPLHRP